MDIQVCIALKPENETPEAQSHPRESIEAFQTC